MIIMKKVVVFSIHEDYMSLEEAIRKYNEGYEVYFVSCDETVGVCGFCNPRGVRCLCKLCSHTMTKQIEKIVKMNPERIHHIKMKTLIEKNIVEEKDSFDYCNTKELKDLTYRGVDVGYGAFSVYVTMTRNVMPSYNEHLKKYINYVIGTEIRQTNAILPFIESLKPDLIIFHNGRMSNLKAPYCIAKNNSIDYIATERQRCGNVALMNNFFNTVPHSYEALNEKMEKLWGKTGDKKYEISKSFFTNRYHSLYAGDKIYTRNQIEGELPLDYDASKRNIVIFNSSEDEYFSISKDFDNSSLYSSQYIALKSLFEHYKDNQDIHFYLRIHPNLANVPYKSHTMLYELKYENVTIISPNSKISSYSLMEVAEKVVVFNSTMGLESAYWGKVVIALSKCFYSYQNVVYEPTSEKDFFNMIDNVSLKKRSFKEENVLKPALMIMMGYGGDKPKHIKCEALSLNIPMKNEMALCYTAFKTLGSYRLYFYLKYFMLLLGRKGILSKYGDKFIELTK